MSDKQEISATSAGATIRQTRQSPRAQDRRGGAKMTKEGCETYQNYHRRMQNLSKLTKEGWKSNEEVLKEKRGIIFVGKNILWKIKEKLSRCHISKAGGAKRTISPRARNGLAPALLIYLPKTVNHASSSALCSQ